MKDLRTGSVLIAIVLLLGQALAVRAGVPASGGTAAWEGALGRGSLLAFMDQARRRDLPGWPAVVSSTSKAVLSVRERDEQERLRHLSALLLAGLAAYRQDLRRLPDGEAGQALEGLLAVRDMVTARVSYVNLLLADAIDRALVVEVAQRLVAGRRVAPELAPGLIRLSAFDFGVGHLVEMAESERGMVFTAESLDRGGLPAQVFQRLLAAVSPAPPAGEEPLDRLLRTTTPAEAGALRLLTDPDLARLLARYWATDHVLHVSLPLLADYIRRAPSFSPDDGYDKVRAALSLDEASLRRYGSPLSPATPTAAYDVAALLRSLRTGEIENFVRFDGPAVTPPSPSASPAGDGTR